MATLAPEVNVTVVPDGRSLLLVGVTGTSKTLLNRVGLGFSIVLKKLTAPGSMVDPGGR